MNRWFETASGPPRLGAGHVGIALSLIPFDARAHGPEDSPSESWNASIARRTLAQRAMDATLAWSLGASAPGAKSPRHRPISTRILRVSHTQPPNSAVSSDSPFTPLLLAHSVSIAASLTRKPRPWIAPIARYEQRAVRLARWSQGELTL
jgi:hypothetical protein